MLQLFFSSLMAHRPACVKCTWVEKVYKQWGTCTDSRPWGASFLCDSSSCHSTGAPSSFICSQLTATLGFEAIGCLVCVSRLVFFEGLSLRASSGSAGLVWSQRTSSAGPCGVVTALLPGFESIQNLHRSPWDCLHRAGKILPQGCFPGSSALCECSWLTDPALEDI